MNMQLQFYPLVVALALFAPSCGHEPNEEPPYESATESILQDKTMTHDVMQRIAADKELRKRMLEMMLREAVGDSAYMAEMCRQIVDDTQTHAMLVGLVCTDDTVGIRDTSAPASGSRIAPGSGAKR